MEKSNRIMSGALTGVFVVALCTLSGFKPAENSPLNWLRSNFQSVKSACNESDILYTTTKTYSFYDSAFVIRTETAYEDKDLNGPAYFSKIFYRDIIWEDSLAVETRISRKNEINPEECTQFNYYQLEVAQLYTTAGKEPPEGGKWYTFNEQSVISLYLPTDEKKCLLILTKLRQLTGKKD